MQCNINASSRVKRILWEQVVLPFQIKKHKIDLLFSSGHTKPFYCPSNSALTIFDMQHINQPEFFSKIFITIVKAIIYISAKTADHIITISNNSKNDIVKHYNIASNKVSTIHLASNKDVFYKRPDSEVESVKAKYGLKGKYIHYAAASLPHKNHRRLLNAFKEIKSKFNDLKLVFTGARDYGENKILEHIKSQGLENDVIVLGWLPFDEVASIYSGAELFVFPSTHEGFGMPVLEAMSTGTAVASSNIEPLKEIVGDGALLFDPYDENSIKEGILSILEDNTLRETLIEKGFARVSHFTWKNTAKETIEIFNSFKV